MSAVVAWPAAVLRKMRESDLPAVLAIEQDSYDFPWTASIFRDCLRVGYYSQVYVSQHGVLGYSIMSLSAGECHLLNLCIHPEFRARGLGSRLIGQLLDVARRKRAGIMLLEVRTSNHAAYRLYTRMGFNEIGMRKDYYPARRGREDALVLAWDLGDGLDIARR